MNEILKINFDYTDRPTVSGRTLHEALGGQTPYRLWFPRMCEYGFVEGADYTPYFFVHPQNNQKTEDHQLTIDMAKEIAMLQRTERGRQIRQSFIQLEKDWNSPEKVMARTLLIASDRIETRDRVIRLQSEEIVNLKPKAEFYELAINSKDLLTMQEAAQIIGADGIGQNNLIRFLKREGILQLKGLPMQRFIERGYFRVKEEPWEASDGNVYLTRKTLVTQKGLEFISKRLIERGYAPRLPSRK